MSLRLNDLLKLLQFQRWVAAGITGGRLYYVSIDPSRPPTQHEYPSRTKQKPYEDIGQMNKEWLLHNLINFGSSSFSGEWHDPEAMLYSCIPFYGRCLPKRSVRVQRRIQRDYRRINDFETHRQVSLLMRGTISNDD